MDDGGSAWVSSSRCSVMAAASGLTEASKADCLVGVYGAAGYVAGDDGAHLVDCPHGLERDGLWRQAAGVGCGNDVG